MSDLRTMIRELLTEELGRMDKSVQRRLTTDDSPEEPVSIHSTADLSRFAARVLALAADPDNARRIEQGRYPFRLADAASNDSSTSPDHPPPSNSGHHFEKGVVSEKNVANLASGIRQVSCGVTVCLTPLARDALRRRGITIVRKAP